MRRCSLPPPQKARHSERSPSASPTDAVEESRRVPLTSTAQPFSPKSAFTPLPLPLPSLSPSLLTRSVILAQPESLYWPLLLLLPVSRRHSSTQSKNPNASQLTSTAQPPNPHLRRCRCRCRCRRSLPVSPSPSALALALALNAERHSGAARIPVLAVALAVACFTPSLFDASRRIPTRPNSPQRPTLLPATASSFSSPPTNPPKRCGTHRPKAQKSAPKK